jgi:predicted esterase
MRARYPSTRMLVVGILSIAIGGCGSNSGSGGSGAGSRAGGAGGGAAQGGSGGGSGGGAGSSGSGGSSASGGRTGQSGTGGVMGQGGSAASGGVTGSGGQAGGVSGGGGQPVGGQVGSGGSAQTGGATGAAGQSGGGGQAGRAAGGSTQTGGATGAAGQSGGGQAGPGAGGSGAGGSGAGGRTGGGGQAGTAGQRSISFGTLLDAQAVVSAAQELAKSLANPSSAQWQAKGDQHRTYRFADANANEPYRIYVPTNWDGKSNLPLAMFLHGSGSDENSYLDQNNKQMITLAQEHGYLLVSPLGDKGAYGNFLRLSSPFGKPDEAAKLMAQVTPDSERTNELSEQDVINVLELVLAEYPVDRASMFLFGHSMGSGGTWYIGGKYADYWKGLAPMSGPFVQETGYPWDDVRRIYLFVTEGTQAPSLDGSHVLRDWLSKNGFKSKYEEVNADHGGMIKLVLPDIFDFFDSSRTAP